MLCTANGVPKLLSINSQTIDSFHTGKERLKVGEVNDDGGLLARGKAVLKVMRHAIESANPQPLSSRLPTDPTFFSASVLREHSEDL